MKRILSLLLALVLLLPGCGFKAEEDSTTAQDAETIAWDNRHGPSHFTYFNVTSDFLADTDHQWDYDNAPEATAEDGGRG
ncbi:MAG: hypothetical protein HFF42_08725 [Lawsonibacter sp.]|nr:hypothetical protein [Lawsonibacter sp.]